jgi:hypothetical protein
MIRKYLFQIITLLVLLVAVIVVVATNSKSTIKKELRDFAIEDTAAVDKIFLADKEGHTIILERKKQLWMVNGKYEARADLIRILLETFHDMRIKEPVAKAALENVIRNLAVKSVKTEIYQNGKLTKTYYVGGPTQDSYGTFMIIEGSSTPFIIEIPGFRGYLSTRYSVYDIDWKTSRVFNLAPSDILQVIYEDYRDAQKSYIIDRTENGFKIASYPGGIELTQFDDLKLRAYVSQFRKKNFSKYIDDVPQEWQDSVKQSPAMYKLSVTTIDGQNIWYKAYNKPGWGRLNEFGERLTNDPDHFFMWLWNGDFVYAQYFVFDPVVKSLQYFKVK